MKPSDHRVAYLDYCRGIAILGVFLVHCLWASFGYSELPWKGSFRSLDVPASFLWLLPATIGRFGVAVFFVVSGFCIHVAFQRNKDWRDFALRRIFRIYPPYLIALLFFALIFPATRLSFHSLKDILQLLSHLALVQNWNQTSFFGINPVFWSIAVEVQLYLLYPLLLVLTRKLGWVKALGLLALVEVSIRTICMVLTNYRGYPEAPRWLSGSPFLYWFSWSLGAYVAESYLHQSASPLARWSGMTVLIVAIGTTLLRPLAYYSFLAFSLFTAVWIASRFNAGPVRRRLSQRFFQHLSLVGVWSYSLYLFHEPILESISGLVTSRLHGVRAPELAIFGLCLATWLPLVGIAGLCYRWGELPSIALGKRISRMFAVGPKAGRAIPGLLADGLNEPPLRSV